MSYSSYLDVPLLYGSARSLRAWGEWVETALEVGGDLVFLGDSRHQLAGGFGSPSYSALLVALARKYGHVPRFHGPVTGGWVSSPLGANPVTAHSSSGLVTTEAQSHAQASANLIARKLSGTGSNTGHLVRLDPYLRTASSMLELGEGQSIIDITARLRWGITLRHWESAQSTVNFVLWTKSGTIINLTGGTARATETGIDASVVQEAGSPLKFTNIYSSWHDCSAWLAPPDKLYVLGNWRSGGVTHGQEFVGVSVESERRGGISPIYVGKSGYQASFHQNNHPDSLPMLRSACAEQGVQALCIAANVNDAWSSGVTASTFKTRLLTQIAWVRGHFGAIPVVIYIQHFRLTEPFAPYPSWAAQWEQYAVRAAEIADEIDGVIVINTAGPIRAKDWCTPPGLTFQGEYDPGRTYQVDDYVYSGSVGYRRINAPGSGEAPPGTNWRSLSAAYDPATSYPYGDCCVAAGIAWTWIGPSPSGGGVEPGTSELWRRLFPYAAHEYVHPTGDAWRRMNNLFVAALDSTREFIHGRRSAPKALIF